jgi:hypothetical protein
LFFAPAHHACGSVLLKRSGQAVVSSKSR